MGGLEGACKYHMDGMVMIPLLKGGLGLGGNDSGDEGKARGGGIEEWSRLVIANRMGMRVSNGGSIWVQGMRVGLR